MNQEQGRKIIRELEKHLPIKRKIESLSAAKAPTFMAKLLKDEGELKYFLADPARALKKAGIDSNEVDINLFTDLLLYLKKKEEFKYIPNDPQRTTVGAQDCQKEEQKKTIWNFEHDKEAITKYEWKAERERGRETEKTKGEITNRDKGYNKKGVGIDPITLLSPDLRAHFYPMQPLVTPELIEKIKQILE